MKVNGMALAAMMALLTMNGAQPSLPITAKSRGPMA